MQFTYSKRAIPTNCFAVLFLVMLSLMLSTSQEAFAKPNQDTCNGGGRTWSMPNIGNGASYKCWGNVNDYYGRGNTTTPISVAVIKVQARGYQTSGGALPAYCDKTSGIVTGFFSVWVNSPVTNVVTCGGTNHQYWAVSQHWVGSSSGTSYNP